MKQQAPKTLPQKAETIENTRKTADILIGAACHLVEPKKDIYAKNPEVSTVSPHRYTMCHGGSSRYGQEAGRKRMNLCLRPASAILIDVNSNYASCRGFQAQSDKMPCFQGFAGFHRVCRKNLNFPESLENTGQNSFFRFADGSSQTVVKPLPLKRDRHDQTSLVVKICC